MELSAANLIGADKVFVFVGSSMSGVETPNLWRREQINKILRQSTYDSDPSLVWELVVWLRAHLECSETSESVVAMSNFVKALRRTKEVAVVTTAISTGLDLAGVADVIHLSGSIDDATCPNCTAHVFIPDLRLSDPLAKAALPPSASAPRTAAEGRTALPPLDLPLCPHTDTCPQQVLRPSIRFIGEGFDDAAVTAADAAIAAAQVGVFVGIPPTTEPAVKFANLLSARRKHVAVIGGGPTVHPRVPHNGPPLDVLRALTEIIFDECGND